MPNVGDICFTPDPKGLVHVEALGYDFTVRETIAYVSFVFDHPSGYKKGNLGVYLLDDLEFVSFGHWDMLVCPN